MPLPASVQVFRNKLEYKKGIIAWDKPSFIFVFDKRGNKLECFTNPIAAKIYCDNWELIYN